jgi:hypothetical protein
MAADQLQKSLAPVSASLGTPLIYLCSKRTALPELYICKPIKLSSAIPVERFLVLITDKKLHEFTMTWQQPIRINAN